MKSKKKARSETQRIPTKPLNRSLHAAKATKQDEFYTQRTDIEKELKHYKKHFRGKSILCNCDDPKVSQFFKYFADNFEHLKLKKLITTCYKNCDADLFSKHTAEKGIYLEYNGDKNDNRIPDPDEIGIHQLKGDGDFRSEECIKLLKQADIVVTNTLLRLCKLDPAKISIDGGRLTDENARFEETHMVRFRKSFGSTITGKGNTIRELNAHNQRSVLVVNSLYLESLLAEFRVIHPITGFAWENRGRIS